MKVSEIVHRERERNMKSVCLDCRNREAVEYVKDPVSNIGYWTHGNRVCEAGPIRDRAMKYGPSRRR